LVSQKNNNKISANAIPLHIMKFNLIKYNSLDSTNAEAYRLYQSGKAVSGTVILTAEQTSGKGYGNNYWESEPGKNLTFSLLFEPQIIMPSDQFIITQIISLSVLEILSKIIKEKTCLIKWPNDIYINDNKIAGILIQNFIIGNNIDCSIIGVGLNVNQQKFLSDAPNPTSIKLESNNYHSLEEILDGILNRFNQYALQLPSPSFIKSLSNNYLNHLYRYGVSHTYRDSEGTFTAVITGISEYGQLLLKKDDKTIKAYGFKEVEFL